MGKEPLKTLTEGMYYVLLSLYRGERCGTEIATFVREATAGRTALGPGTLYTLLAKFQDEELIAETGVDGRKRTYRLTGKGQEAFNQELARLRACVTDGEEELV